MPREHSKREKDTVILVIPLEHQLRFILLNTPRKAIVIFKPVLTRDGVFCILVVSIFSLRFQFSLHALSLHFHYTFTPLSLHSHCAFTTSCTYLEDNLEAWPVCG